MKRFPLVVLLLLVACGIILWPLGQPGFFVSDDGEWMVIRLSAFYQALVDGQFPVRFLGRLNHEFGYPVANFLYPGFLYLGSLLHGLGIPLVGSLKLILASSVIGAAFFIFFWLRTRFSLATSFLGTLGFIFHPYVTFDLYKRGSVGEILAFWPAAMAVWAIAQNQPLWLALAVGALILAHNSLAFLVLPILAGYILVLRRRLFSFMGLGIGLATFFWLPALIERRYVLFDQVAVSQPLAYLVGGDRLTLLGWVNILVLFLLITRRKQLEKTTIFLIVVSLIGLWAATPLSSTLWTVEAVGKLVQFPYRTLSVVALVGPWLIAAVSEKLKPHQSWLMVVFIILWLGPVVSNLSQVVYTQKPEGFYATNEGTTTVANEYLPRWVTEPPQRRAEQRLEVLEGKAQITPRKVTPQYIDVGIEASDKLMIQLNTIYYPGWGAMVDSLPVAVRYDNPLGVMRLAVPAGHHRLVAAFRETPLRFGADLISLLSLIVWLILAMRRVKSQKGLV